MQVFTQWNCPNWWKNLGKINFRIWGPWALGYINNKSENFYLCEWNIFPINNNIIMNECTNSSIYLGEFKIKLTSLKALSVFVGLNNFLISKFYHLLMVNLH